MGDNDLKTTIIGIIGGILTLAIKFGAPIEPAMATSIATVVATITVMLLGYFTNKKAS